MLDRFAVCTAYNMYAIGYNGAREANEYAARLRRIGFRPGSNGYNIEDYHEDDRHEVSRIYGNLVMQHNHTYVCYERLRRRAKGRVRSIVSWPGTRSMGMGERTWLARRGLLDAVNCYDRIRNSPNWR